MSKIWARKGTAAPSEDIPIRIKPEGSRVGNRLPSEIQPPVVAQRKTVAQRSTVSTTQFMPESSTVTNRGSQAISRMPTDKILGFEAYSEGTIFCALFHHPHYNQAFREGVDVNDGYIAVLGPPGSAVVYSKYRKFIVVARFAHHCIVLGSSPVFTHGGKGLNSKEDGFDLNEFISIRDARSKETAAKTETPRYGILWATQNRGYERTGFMGPMTDFTAVQISSPHSHNYQWPATRVAELTDDSKELLQKLYTDSMLDATGSDKAKPKTLTDEDGFQTASSRRSNFTSNKSLYKHPASMRGRPTPRSLLPNYH